MLLDRPPAPSIARFIREHHAMILFEWEQTIRKFLPQPLDRPALLDHIPALLKRLADRLDEPSQHADAVAALTKSHALTRLDIGTDLRVVVFEYSELRRCILRLWEQQVGPQGHIGEAELVHIALDEAMLESMTQFTAAHRRTLEAVDRISLFGLDSPNLDAFFPKLLGAFREHTEAVDMTALYLRDGTSLRLRASVGLTEEQSRTIMVGQGLVGRVAAGRRSIQLRCGEQEEDEPLCGPGSKAFYAVPLLDRDELVGVALMGSRTAPEFSEADQQLLRVLAARATTLIVQHQLIEAERAARAEAEMRAQELRGAIAAREELLAVVSHDLRNPLAAIGMNLARILRQTPEGESGARIKESALIASRAVERMERQIADLLDAAQIEGGRLLVERTAHDVHALIAEVMDGHRALADARQVRLELVPAERAVVVECDRVRVAQVLGNLIDNAIKFTPAGGLIRVRAAREDGFVRCSVTDTGRGIAPADLSRIWDRGWQARPGREKGSLGLGLFIANGIVRAHGGAMAVESAPDQGTTFSFTLPSAGA